MIDLNYLWILYLQIDLLPKFIVASKSMFTVLSRSLRTMPHTFCSEMKQGALPVNEHLCQDLLSALFFILVLALGAVLDV